MWKVTTLANPGFSQVFCDLDKRYCWVDLLSFSLDTSKTLIESSWQFSIVFSFYLLDQFFKVFKLDLTLDTSPFLK